MKEKKNQYNKQYSNFQYRSRDISLFLLITRIFGRKGEQLLRAIYTIESYHKSVGEGRISTLRSVSTYTESRLVFQSVSLPVYSERNDRGGEAERRLHVASGNRPPPVIDFPSTRWSLEPVEIRLAFRTVAALPRRQIVVIKFHHGEGVREREGIIEREREEGGGGSILHLKHRQRTTVYM